MKKFVSFLIMLAMVCCSVNIFAENVPSKTQGSYEDMISIALQETQLGDSADKENVFVIEESNYIELGKGNSPVRHYIAIPTLDSDKVYYSYFKDGEHIVTLADLPLFTGIESPDGKMCETYIENNSLSDIEEVTVMAVFERLHMFAFYVKTADGKYIIPYYFLEDSIFNVTDVEDCRLEKGVAYSVEDFVSICEKESEIYDTYRAEIRAQENKTVISVNEDGDEVVKVGGVSLENIKNDILDNIEIMEKDSYVEINLTADDERVSSEHRYENGSSAKELAEFTENLFEELSVQAGKKTDSFSGENCCSIKLRFKEDGKWVRHNTYIDLSENAVRIRTENHGDISFELKNADAVRKYLAEASEKGFETFENQYYGKNTPDIVGNIDGFTKTDVVEFSFAMPENSENDLSEEVASKENTVKGILTKYKENKYKSTYILTLSGDKGEISLYVNKQFSLGSDEEKLSNNIPLYFLNQNRYENGNLVMYRMKDSNSYSLKLVFKNGDISEAVFENVNCNNLKYTNFTRDAELAEEFTEREREAFVQEKKTGEEASENLKALGVMKGDPDGNMRLNDEITRAEATALLVRLHKNLNKNVPSEFAGFSDMEGHWADEEITYAKNAGITDGTSEATFAPENHITVQDFAKMLVSLLGYKEYAEARGGYPHGYMITATKLGIMNDVSAVVTDEAVRGDVSIMLDYALDIPHIKKDFDKEGNTIYIIMDGKEGREYKTFRTVAEEK